MELESHYGLPPLGPLDLDRILRLVRFREYFVLHAPRGTGKTSALLALERHLNSGGVGGFRCLYVNFESARAQREDFAESMRAILNELAARAEAALGDGSLRAVCDEVLARFGRGNALRLVLRRWAQADPRPLVLLIDGIDGLVGNTLLSVLHQIRSGFDLRPGAFPQSIVLCGVQDVRDGRIHSGFKIESVSDGSVFNIAAMSFRLGDFSRDDIAALVGQHTAETGQTFSAGATERIWTQTQGQPWLVSALCNEVCFEGDHAMDRGREITSHDILEARETLIQRPGIHLQQLADKLRDDRLQRVVKPILGGSAHRHLDSGDLEFGMRLIF